MVPVGVDRVERELHRHELREQGYEAAQAQILGDVEARCQEQADAGDARDAQGLGAVGGEIAGDLDRDQFALPIVEPPLVAEGIEARSAGSCGSRCRGAAAVVDVVSR